MNDPIATGAVIGGIIAAMQGIIFIGDRLWKRETKPDQSVQCGFQHRLFEGALGEQTAALKEMCIALRTLTSDAQLRHQIIVDKLDRIHDAVHRHENAHQK